MERIRIVILATAFIGLAVLVWLWSSSNVTPEPASPIEPPAASDLPETAPQPDMDAPVAPPSVASAPATKPEPSVPEVEQPVLPEPPQLAERIRQPEPAKAVVSGRVTVEGQPATGFSLNAEVVQADGSTRGVPVQTSESGAYRLESPPGDLQILFDVVDQSGARPTHIETITVAAGRTYQLDYDFQASGSIRGHVTGIAEGEYAGLLVLLGEYTIEATVPDDIYALADEADGEMTVRRDGEYVLDNLEAGRYTVVVITRLLDEQQIRERDYEFRYMTGYVDVQPGQEAEFNVTLE